MKKVISLLPILMIIFVSSVSALTIIANDATFIGVPWNESVVVVNSTNLTMVNNSFTDGFTMINSVGVFVSGGSFNESANHTADNLEFNGVTFFDDVFVIDSTNITYLNCKFYGDFTTQSSSEIFATNNYWNSDYAPLNGEDGCPDGTGGDVSSDVPVSPWYRDEALTDSSSNCKPSLAEISDQVGNLNHLWTYTAVCTDPNVNDTIVYTDNTSLFVIGASSGIMSYTPTSPIDEAIRITCSDSEYVDTEDFQLTVQLGSGYVSTYTGNSISEVVIDNIVGIGAVIATFSVVIGAFLIYNLLLRRLKKW